MYLVYGMVAILLIGFFISYVYFKKPKYGIILAVISLSLIAVAVYWNVSENSRKINAAQKIPLQQILLSQQHIEIAYGNRYLYRANIENKSSVNQLISLQLQLSIKNKPLATALQLTKWIKVWLAPQKTTALKAYFSSEQLAEKLSDGQWQVKVVATKARN